MLLFALVAGALVPASAAGAVRTWTGLGATTNWNEAMNWSGAAVPGAADTAVFDATSSKAATINVNVSIAGLSINAGYGGTLSQAGAATVTVGATGYSQSAGTFVGGTGSITVNGPFTHTAGAFTSTSGSLSVTRDFTDSSGSFVPNAGALRLLTSAATITVSGGSAFNDVDFVSGTKTLAAGTTFVVNGTLALTSATVNGAGTLAARGAISQASTFGGGTALLLIDGSANQTFTGAATVAAGALPNL
ncbi:MAG TPA: hypothetical protein VIA82_08255, partial [Candidatus Limnocylindria bacterium]